MTKFYNGFVQCSNFPYGNGFDLLYSTLADDFYWYSENNYTIPDATDFVGYNCDPFTLVVNSLWIQNTVCATESDGKRTIVAFWWYNIDLISNPYNLTSAYKDSNNRTHVDVYTNPADFTPINPPININVWNTDIHYVTWDKYQEAYVDHYLISELDSVILYQYWNLAAIPNDE